MPRTAWACLEEILILSIVLSLAWRNEQETPVEKVVKRGEGWVFA
jgi:hypothetical protein